MCIISKPFKIIYLLQHFILHEKIVSWTISIPYSPLQSFWNLSLKLIWNIKCLSSLLIFIRGAGSFTNKVDRCYCSINWWSRLISISREGVSSIFRSRPIFSEVAALFNSIFLLSNNSILSIFTWKKYLGCIKLCVNFFHFVSRCSIESFHSFYFTVVDKCYVKLDFFSLSLIIAIEYIVWPTFYVNNGDVTWRHSFPREVF